MKKIGLIVLILLSLLIILFIVRLISPKELDDVSPQIPCETTLLENSDILYVIPYYNNISISENKEWCNYILSLNKTLELHGIYHTYREFLYNNISQEELNLAINEFEKCFGYKPDMFKSPQLKISKHNKELIKSDNLILKNDVSQTTHKVYHCNNTGRIDNKIIRFF